MRFVYGAGRACARRLSAPRTGAGFCLSGHGVRCLPPVTWPRYSRGTQDRFCMIFRASLFSAFVLLLVAAACLVGAGPARAQDTLYTVNGVHVDATGASSGEASNQAIAQGRAKAFQILFRRLTRQADWARQPPLDAASLLRLSRGTNITN